MKDAAFLALRYLRSAPGRTFILVSGLAIVLFLPVFTLRAGQWLEETLLERAEATPIVIGAKGNEFDLTMSSLYFRGQVSDPIEYRERSRIEMNDYGVAVPLLVRYTVLGAPLVGTSPEYFEIRRLSFAQGRRPAQLGEVVVGAELAAERGLQIGDTVRSDLTNLYNLAGSYPILLEVVGILERTASPDDRVFFADIRSAWVIEGRLHGHEAVLPGSEFVVPAEPADRDAASGASGRSGAGSDDPEADAAEGENVEASAAIFLFQKIEDSNRDSFHLHGDTGEAPISSLLVFPSSARERDQLLGDYALDPLLQAIQPTSVLDTVLQVVLRLRDALLRFYALVLLSMLAFFGLIVSLSMRLRAADLTLMRRIGSARFTVVRILAVEMAIMLVGAALVSFGLVELAMVLMERSVL